MLYGPSVPSQCVTVTVPAQGKKWKKVMNARRRLIEIAGAAGLAATILTVVVFDAAIAQGGNIYQATLAEPNQKTGEVSTEDVRCILADGSAIVLDSRKRSEFV